MVRPEGTIIECPNAWSLAEARLGRSSRLSTDDKLGNLPQDQSISVQLMNASMGP